MKRNKQEKHVGHLNHHHGIISAILIFLLYHYHNEQARKEEGVVDQSRKESHRQLRRSYGWILLFETSKVLTLDRIVLVKLN